MDSRSVPMTGRILIPPQESSPSPREERVGEGQGGAFHKIGLLSPALLLWVRRGRRPPPAGSWLYQDPPQLRHSKLAHRQSDSTAAAYRQTFPLWPITSLPN